LHDSFGALFNEGYEMKCIVTGKETNNKWKGFPICKEAIELARLMEGQEGFLHKTMRKRLQILQQRWQERVREEAKV
jgi:hypothetical protein